jgi:hypothetical protein
VLPDLEDIVVPYAKGLVHFEVQAHVGHGQISIMACS